MDYNSFLMNKFNQPLTGNKLLYEKLDTSHIVLYKWENGCAYRAPYRCLPASFNDLDVMNEYIEKKFSVVNKRGEYYLFICELKGDYDVPDIEIRLLDYQDEVHLDALKNACTIEESALAQLTIHDIHVIGAFKEGLLVGCSSIINLHEAYDVGILIHPKYRCMGLSTMLVAKNTEWVLSEGRLCIYRCDDFNVGSYKTAIKLGYQKFVDVIVYDLKEE